jgi:hypothetical protein
MTKITGSSYIFGGSPQALCNREESEKRVTEQHLFRHSSSAQPLAPAEL